MQNRKLSSKQLLHPAVANRHGFTYMLALVIIMISGIMLGMAGQSWQQVIKREKEAELIFRGTQIRDAITRWYKAPRAQQVSTPLNELKDLLEDPRSLTKARYLRRLYKDPVTGGDWGIIRDSNKGIIGVYSQSIDKPLKTGGFPDDMADFADKTRYSDWKFIYTTQTQSATPAKTVVR